MRIEIKMVLVLTVIALISGLVLGLAYEETSPKIEKNLELAKGKALKKVVPNVASYEAKQVDRYTTIFTAKDSSGNIAGYGVLIEGSGFQGPIKLMVGFDTTMTKLTGLEVIENIETPGLGNRITEEWFKKQFVGRVPPIEVVKGKKPVNEHEIQAITGATISSRSVVRIVNTAQSKLLSSLPRASYSPPKSHGQAAQKQNEGEKKAAVSAARTHRKIEKRKRGREEKSVSLAERKPEKPDTTCLKYMSEFVSPIRRCRTIPMPDSLDAFLACRGSGDSIIGVIVRGTGFMDRIKLLVAMDAGDFRIIGIKILEMAEGEAFGNGRDSTFWSQFNGRTPPLALKSDDRPNGIDAISGATETSEAVITIINMAKIRAEKALSEIQS